LYFLPSVRGLELGNGIEDKEARNYAEISRKFDLSGNLGASVI
jgi:hypothetical protein